MFQQCHSIAAALSTWLEYVRLQTRALGHPAPYQRKAHIFFPQFPKLYPNETSGYPRALSLVFL